ncbi:TPA: hypothetical protein ACP321_005336 [Pseudomonas aeruginosa]
MQDIMKNSWNMDISSIKPSEIPIFYFHAEARRIQPTPRTIKLADNFSYDKKHSDGWTEIKNKIEQGKDLSPYLSLGIEIAARQDDLLFEWGVHHLHLGTRPHSKKTNFVERTGPLLFGHFTQDTFYAIGIYSHEDWCNTTIIESLAKNWPEKLSNYKAAGITKPAQIYTEEDRKTMRKRGANILTTLPDGTTLWPIGGGYNVKGISLRAIREQDREREHIKTIENKVLSLKSKIEEKLILEGYSGDHEVTARLDLHTNMVTFNGYNLKIKIQNTQQLLQLELYTALT